MRSISRSSDRTRALRGVGAIAGLSLAAGAATGVAQGQSVVCWGQNSDDQCTVPAALGPIASIAAGGWHSVALKASGTVACWGWNDFGQCDVPGGLSGVASVSAGDYHTVALTQSGSVVCWGDNLFGQCAAPVGLGTVVTVSARGYHTIALRPTGSVACWGRNLEGQCTVPGGLGVVAKVAAGGLHSVAVKSGGSVACWGLNTNGQCNVPAGLGSIAAISAGYFHTVALKGDGTVACWGDNSSGQCSVPAGLGQVASVAGGGAHTIALKSDGTVTCWGNNGQGQCAAPSQLAPMAGIAAGHEHSVGLAAFSASLSSAAASLAPGDTFYVRASCTTPSALLSGAQLAVHFDAARLRLDLVEPVATSGLDMELAEQVNNTAGTLRYALGMSDPTAPLDAGADLCNLHFTVLPGADLCGAANLVTFGDVGAFTTRFTRFDNAAPVVPVLTNLPPINLDSTPPVLSGVPAANITVATDAGSTFGALVSLPTVTAVDACEGAVSVTVTGANASGLYPIGTTTVTWSATDSVGNAVSVSRNIVVGNYQLLDARISLTNPQLGASNHAFRIVVGSTVQVIDAVMPAWAGSVPSVATVAGIQVPVSAGYECATAKSVAVPAGGSPRRWSHTITDAAPVSIAGARYSASFSLVPGDSNDDDMVEILDYGNFVVDRSSLANPSSAAEARSNYNGDNLVINDDFGVFSAYFFRVGESCTPPLHAPQPRTRVSVKELRRSGLGDLAVADINGDGWVDTRDMQMYMQGGGGAIATPTAPTGGVSNGW